MEQLGYAQQGVEGGVWQLFAEEGEMKMYRREEEEGGLVVDPLKAVHQVRGATAHEMAHHFWSPDVRFEWDSKLFFSLVHVLVLLFFFYLVLFLFFCCLLFLLSLRVNETGQGRSKV